MPDLYDPSRPNDYMAYCRYRLEMKKREEQHRELEAIMAEKEAERIAKEQERQEQVRQLLQNQATAASVAASSAPPGGRGRGAGRGVSNLPAWLTKQQAGGGADADSAVGAGGAAARPAGSASDGRFDDAPAPSNGFSAAKMLGAMGWEEGKGLGRTGQGISQSIVAQPTGNGTGTISLHPNDLQRTAEAANLPPPPARKRGLFSNPTRILLLKNMVGPGEVDDSLEEETKEECAKYGHVERCCVRELPPEQRASQGIPDEEAVWIFVQYTKQASAVAAFRGLSGRFFAGRMLSASFYDEAKFEAGNLLPQP